jgi:hypothetical protein
MKTSDIRARVHAAVGEARYPAALSDRVARRIAEPIRPSHSRAYGLVAAVLAALLVATLVFTRFGLGPLTGTAPATPFHTNQVVGPVNPDTRLPDEDLRVAAVSGPLGRLVTPLNLTAVSGGRSVSLIGAYADTARIVLFFRGEGQGFSVHPQIYDRTGFLNYGSGEGSGLAGDWVVILMGGAHPDADGTAHLDVAVDQYQTDPAVPGVSGTWNFSLDVKVQPADALTMMPPLTTIGPWKVAVEAMEATPTVVRFQAVVKGASPSEVTSSMVTLVDGTGHEVPRSSEYSELTNQMFFFLVIGTPETRINVIWLRPLAATYELRITARGVDYRAKINIPPGPS